MKIYVLAIRARAEMRLAEEYDAAQDRKEVRTRADNQHFSEGNKLSAKDLNIAPKEMFEARQFRDAENAEPGLIKRALGDVIERD